MLDWTWEDSPDEARLALLSMEMAARIHDCSGSLYRFDKVHGGLKLCGTAMDWFYSDEANVNNKYRAASLLIEIENVNEFHFGIPPSKVTVLLLCFITS